jgi:hypothetical protein
MVRDYSGIAAIPNPQASRVDPRVPPRRSVTSACPYRPPYLPGRAVADSARLDDVGLSPVKIVSHCAQAKPPDTKG